MDAAFGVEHFAGPDERADLDAQSCLLEDLPFERSDERLAELDLAGGHGPLAKPGFLAAADEEDAAGLIDDNAADGDYGSELGQGRPGMSMEDDILVVPRADVEALGLLGDGITPGSLGVVTALEGRGTWMRRSVAEDDATHKQLIPYCVAIRQGEVFVMERLSAGGEPRLHGRLSVGTGGHVDLEPGGDTLGAVERARDREWLEEVVCNAAPTWRFVGTLNVDADAVGRVHLGIVYVAQLGADAVVDVRETHKLRGGFRTLAWCREHEERFETWSRFALKACVPRPDEV